MIFLLLNMVNNNAKDGIIHPYMDIFIDNEAAYNFFVESKIFRLHNICPSCSTQMIASKNACLLKRFFM